VKCRTRKREQQNVALVRDKKTHWGPEGVHGGTKKRTKGGKKNSPEPGIKHPIMGETTKYNCPNIYCNKKKNFLPFPQAIRSNHVERKKEGGADTQKNEKKSAVDKFGERGGRVAEGKIGKSNGELVGSHSASLDIDKVKKPNQQGSPEGARKTNGLKAKKAGGNNPKETIPSWRKKKFKGQKPKNNF